MLEYFSEHPTAADILMAVHKIKTSSVRKLKKGLMDENTLKRELDADMGLIPSVLGAPETSDEDFRASVKYAKELMEKMKMNKLDS